MPLIFCSSFFFFNDTATTEIYTLSLHDALPIFDGVELAAGDAYGDAKFKNTEEQPPFMTVKSRIRRRKPSMLEQDRKSTRLNSSHLVISYAVFCLKKKKKIIQKF